MSGISQIAWGSRMARQATASLAVLAVAMLSSPADAQDVRGPEKGGSTQSMDPASTATPVPSDETTRSESASSGGLEEIVVTARKVAENNQDVPVAITAFTGESLQQQNAVRVQDIARLTPGLAIREGTSTNSTLIFSLRGQVQGDVLATLDPSAGTYVDGVYWARTYGLNADLLDLQSVQILKGPQGTLFGRNTTGGAILFQTNDPNFNGLSGRLSGSVGNLDLRSGTAVLNVPIVDDKLAIRMAVQHIKRDGFLRDVGTVNGGDKYDDRDSWAARGKLLFQMTDNLSFLGSVDYYKGKFHGPGRRLGYFVPTGLVAPAPTDAVLAAAVAGRAAQIAAGVAPNIALPFRYGSVSGVSALYAGGNAVLNNYISLLGTDRNITQTNLTQGGGAPRNQARTITYGGTLNLDTFFGAIKFISALREIKSHSDFDLEGSPFALIDSANAQDLQQYSGELQITGKAFDKAVDFAGGVFYFHEDGRDGSTSRAFVRELLPAGGTFAVSSLSTGFNDADIDNDSMGAYAQATWHITDALGFTGGVRYSVDDKGIVVRNRNLNRSTGVITCSLVPRSGTAIVPSDCAARRRDDFSGVSYTFGLDYKITDDVLAYVKTSKGFRSGGQNLRSGSVAAFVPFKPEVARSHEAGLKSEFFDRRVRLNLAGYYTKVDDVQRSSQVAQAAGLPPLTIVGNAAKLRIYGLEGELTARLFDGFTLSATGSVTRPKYLSYPEVPGPNNLLGDRTSERFDTTPRHTFSLSGLYERDLGFGELHLRADYSWTDKFATNSTTFFVGDPFLVTIDTNTGRGLTVAEEIYRASTSPAAGILSGQVGMSFADDMFEVTLFGRNLTNNRDVVLGLPVAGINVVSQSLREPRTYGVTASFRFGS